MAKEKESTRALTGARLMSQPVPSCISAFTGGVFPGSNGWVSTAGGLYYENYFDLSAYELDDLTVIPTLLELQDALQYTASNPPPELQVRVWDIISQEKLNSQSVIDLIDSLDYPSSPGSTQDWSQILMCNYRFFVTQNDFTFSTLLLPATGGALGSSEPTAVQKLWTYRIVSPAANDLEGMTINIPATRFIAGIEVIKEDELPYMMRLKRSYELATQG